VGYVFFLLHRQFFFTEFKSTLKIPTPKLLVSSSVLIEQNNRAVNYLELNKNIHVSTDSGEGSILP
jgi:hypothetical protein